MYIIPRETRWADLHGCTQRCSWERAMSLLFLYLLMAGDDGSKKLSLLYLWQVDWFKLYLLAPRKMVLCNAVLWEAWPLQQRSMLMWALGPWLYILSLLTDNGFGSWLNAGNRFLHKASVTIHCPCLRGEWWTPIQEHWPAQLWSTLSALWWIRQPSFNGYFYEHICELVNNTSSQMHINKLRTHPPIFFS